MGSIRGVEYLIPDKFANGVNYLVTSGGPEKFGHRDRTLWNGCTHVPDGTTL